MTLPVDQVFFSDEKLKWFAVYVQARREEFVAEAMASRSHEHFLPMRVPESSGSGRVRREKAPLFPGYLFCRLNLGDRHMPVVSIPGVIRLVGNGRKPLPVPDCEIDSLRIVVASCLRADPISVPEIGKKVRIIRGPLSGVEGVLISIKNRHRLVVGVQMIQRQVAVEIEDNWVTKLDVTGDLLQSLARDSALSEYRARSTPAAPAVVGLEQATQQLQ
jgi:transcription antitermination factor NusG